MGYKVHSKQLKDGRWRFMFWAGGPVGLVTGVTVHKPGAEDYQQALTSAIERTRSVKDDSRQERSRAQ